MRSIEQTPQGGEKFRWRHGNLLDFGCSRVTGTLARLHVFSVPESLPGHRQDAPNGSATVALMLTSSVTGSTLEHSASVGGFAVDPLGSNNTVVFSHLFDSAIELAIRRTNNDAIISWPTGDPALNLTCNTNLNFDTWTPVAPLPVIVEGRYTVTNLVTAGQKFYRLQNP